MSFSLDLTKPYPTTSYSPSYWPDSFQHHSDDNPEHQEVISKSNQQQEKGKKKKSCIQKTNRLQAASESLEKKMKFTSTSFVKIKHEKKGLRLIKIKIYDLTAASTEVFDSEPRDGDLISAQYVVTNTDDRIMEETEELVNKISRKMCEPNY